MFVPLATGVRIRVTSHFQSEGCSEVVVDGKLENSNTDSGK